jgi:hypothetical protein
MDKAEANTWISAAIKRDWFNDLMDYFYQGEVDPSKGLPWATIQMVALVKVTAKTYDLSLDEAMKIISLTIEAIKADDNHRNLNETNCLLEEIRECLKNISI